MCQPSIKRFEWELEVVITNLKNLNVTEVVLLFAEFDPSVSFNLLKKYPYLKIFIYKDLRDDTSYIPSIKPYLWYRFLEANKEYENEDFLYIDSDVIFREMINYEQFLTSGNVWYGSDCSGYLSYDYILSTTNGKQTLNDMSKIVGISLDAIKEIGDNCIGAQLIVRKPKAIYWKKVYEDSNKLHHYFNGIDSNIQKWTAEMWAQLWNLPYFNIVPKIDKEFNFSWATDDITEWKKCKIYHNAGVLPEMENLFFKGFYTDCTPFDDDLTYVDDKKCSYHYARAIEMVKNTN